MMKTILTLSLGTATALNSHRVVDNEHLCYQADYFDKAYGEQGFRVGKCPSKYNDVLSVTHEEICNEHSDENVKYCPDSVVTISVKKIGIQSPTVLMYSGDVTSYKVVDEEHLCYEANYYDQAYGEQGYSIGKCPSKYNDVLSVAHEEVCNQHSDENTKYCPNSIVKISVEKIGIKSPTMLTYSGDVTSYKEVTSEHLCYQSDYYDEGYASDGYVLGRCPKKYNDILSTSYEEICNGNSKENTKYCPDSIITIYVEKIGIETNAPLQSVGDEQKYHLGNADSKQCYQTNYTDDDLKAKGWTSGPCDEVFDTQINSITSEVCNGNYDENVKYCVGNTINVTIVELGKVPAWYRASGNLCYSMMYNDEHLTNDEGYAPGLCPKIYNDYLGSEQATYCKGHSEINVKYCQGPLITVNVSKWGESSKMPFASLRGGRA